LYFLGGGILWSRTEWHAKEKDCFDHDLFGIMPVAKTRRSAGDVLGPTLELGRFASSFVKETSAISFIVDFPTM
jgi:hypothetical protein